MGLDDQVLEKDCSIVGNTLAVGSAAAATVLSSHALLFLIPRHKNLASTHRTIPPLSIVHDGVTCSSLENARVESVGWFGRNHRKQSVNVIHSHVGCYQLHDSVLLYFELYTLESNAARDPIKLETVGLTSVKLGLELRD
jgi:hypothetical protein